mmetsp:Transcript_41880/g.76100  ORF Transcript_41880/g.76100 Transcript_41880/m.76100 type:complete len:245 (-) Transcript_41880:83-817(-)
MRRAYGLVQRASIGTGRCGHGVGSSADALSSTLLHHMPRATAHRGPHALHLSRPRSGVVRSSTALLSARHQQLRCLSADAGSEPGSKETEKKDVSEDKGESEETKESPEASAAEAAAEEEAAPPEKEKTEAEKLQLEVDALTQKLKAEKHNLLLALADFENEKKKFAKERQSHQSSAVRRFSQRVCDIFVEFEELQASSEKATEDGALKNLQEGLDMTLHDFASTLEKFEIPRPEASRQGEEAE